MQQKYLYTFNGIAHWVKGLAFFFPEIGSKVVDPARNLQQNFVWRNSVLDGYKIGQAYISQPLDLSNYLLIRTRERFLLENKVAARARVLKGNKEAFWSAGAAEKQLTECAQDLEDNFTHLQKILDVTTETHDFPVAFATNALYVLERNGLTENRKYYDSILLPIIRKKAEYLHAEGVSQAVWALANAGIWDQEIWSVLKRLAVELDFDYSVVKSTRWSANIYQTLTGREHFLESELTEPINKMFFQDKLNFFELYNGLVSANQKNSKLGLDETIRQIENKYSELLKYNELYKEIESVADNKFRISAEQFQQKTLPF